MILLKEIGSSMSVRLKRGPIIIKTIEFLDSYYIDVWVINPF